MKVKGDTQTGKGKKMFFPLILTSCLTVSEFSIHLRSVAKNPLRIPGRIEKR